MSDVLVTVLCKTFNHERYIKDALNGFVMQKTNFKFKVIVQDDASTDKTAEIVREYDNNYPGLFDNIYHTVNQYSQRVNTDFKFIREKLEGKYIAYCEGDDYWTDDQKLQIMVDYMESHPDCSMAYHKYNAVRANDGLVMDIRPLIDEDRNVEPEEVIRKTVEMQLASQIFKVEVFKNRPDFYFKSVVIDYGLSLNSLIYGKVHFINRNMSNYRIMASGSWSEITKKDVNKHVFFDQKAKELLLDFDEYTNHKYKKFIDKKVDEQEFLIYMNTKKYKLAKKTLYYKTSATSTEKIEVAIGHISPGFAVIVKNIYRKIKYRNQTV